MHLQISFERQKAVTPSDFARIVGPLLTMTAPTGMTQDERKAWAHAASMMLSDLTIGELTDAVRDAAKTADHPSKIVPAIRKALEGQYRYVPLHRPITPEPIALPRKDVQAEAEQAEVAELMRDLAAKWSAKHG